MTTPTVRSLELSPAAELFRALGDETRLRIVALLSHGELCVCHIQGALRLNQPTASRHLAVLRSAGVVDARRTASWVYYRLREQTDRARKRHLAGVVEAFAGAGILRKDIERLRRSLGPEACR